jgi:hypothetical protein
MQRREFACALDAGIGEKITHETGNFNFDFCICFRSNLCYGVYIPSWELVQTVPWLEVSCVTGLPARTARPFVPFFCAEKFVRPAERFAEVTIGVVALSSLLFTDSRSGLKWR